MNVAQVALVCLGAHAREAPAIVRMEEDNVSLDTEALEIANPLLEAAKAFGVDSSESPNLGRSARRERGQGQQY
jgi:hypothetical protein